MERLGFSHIKWVDNYLTVLDQRKLPLKEDYLKIKSVHDAVEAIKNLTVRGAPLIGITAAYGLCLVKDLTDKNIFAEARENLNRARPTAVNLFWAVERMAEVFKSNYGNKDISNILLNEALSIHAEDERMCRKIGEHGNSIVQEKCRILTHCNAGALATGGIGTALGVIYAAYWSGKKIEVWVDETRPVLQGARLTAWELQKANIPHTLITDNMAGKLMSDGEVDLIIVGADRVAKNLDFANKIGTYGLAVLARYHNIPFYCAAPTSSFDPDCHDGKSIVIENRDGGEITNILDSRIAPTDTPVLNSAFDVTPRDLLTGLITENGIIYPDDISS